MDATSTRRALIGAMIAVPVLAAPAIATAVQSSRAAWDHAMLAFQQALQASRHYAVTVHDPLDKQVEARFPFREGARRGEPFWRERKTFGAGIGYLAVAEELDRLTNVMFDKEAVLLKMAAPDGAALLWKLDRLFDHDRAPGDASDSVSGKWLDVLMADARRLLGGEVA